MSIYKSFTDRDKTYLEQMVKIHMEQLSESIGVPIHITADLTSPFVVDMHLKFQIGDGGASITVSSDPDAERKDFERLCSRYGFEPSDYGKMVFTNTGIQYKFIGFNTKNRKNACKLLRLDNNTTAKAAPTLVKQLMA